ncbi:MAG: DUF2339 domain-containing protein [Lutibacter sp.]|nr:DUF2339 domain-containing protein [Lutibacter sp.]MDP3944716.1 DUF2339 domain-containing protein [Lutibacter sp.]
MGENQDQIDQLLNKLELLLKKQEVFSKEVQQLRNEITQLRIDTPKKPSEKDVPAMEEPVKTQPIYTPRTAPKTLNRDLDHKILGGVCAGFAQYFGISRILTRIIWLLLTFFFGVGFIAYFILWIALPKVETTAYAQKNQTVKEPLTPVNGSSLPAKSTINLEKFIGENLLNKIGIAITVIGVGIGAKYSIEHDLISPLTRVILGYLVGLALLGFGLKLKEKYENFSAVLVSGAMAIFYFMTFAAYSFYELFPQTIAFIFMVVFTVFTVVAALNYNKQIIALIGLVGAYAVPFLLSEDSGNVAVLFSYMAIINIGILVIAFKKYWKLLYLSAFVLTWLIFTTWYTSKYEITAHFELALTFIFIFFATFYATFLAFKLLQKEKFEIIDILLLLANSFVFYGFGYIILDSHEIGSQLLGLFTLGNGMLHFMVGLVIYKQKLGDKNLFYFVAGLVLVFITIAIPVQLNGNWVTLLWVAEAALLFWIGRTKNIPVYEKISYPLMLIAVISIFQDWATGYNLNYYGDASEKITPILNIHFLSSVLFIAAFGFITFLHHNKKYPSALISNKELQKLVSFAIPAALLGTLYFAFRMEIESYFNQLYADSNINFNVFQQYFNYDYLKFKTIWILNYSLFFGSVFSFVNIKKLKNRQFGLLNLGFNTIAILVFLAQGLYTLSELRDSYLTQTMAAYYQIGEFNIGIRYISFAFVAIALMACYSYIRQEFMKVDYKMAFDLLLHLSILWMASSELINLMELSGSTQSNKLGLSILWGIYALLLISLGIWKTRQHLRIGAIALFSVTLIKLFFYDISHLNTISKTIVFLSLGILLLIISFLYNKFKHLISNEIKS